MKTKKYLFYVAAFALATGISAGFSSCSDDDDDNTTSGSTTTTTTTNSNYELDYTSSNASSWQNYMRNVASLLRQDASDLYYYWSTDAGSGVSYADYFKTHSNSEFSSAINCIEQIIDGCTDIANEVGTSKIGEPYNLYAAGSYTEALYAVESWFSYHSRDDYRNNIYSIRNAYYGSRDGSVSDKSLSAAVAAVNSTLNTTVVNAINAAAEAIYAIPQPFRNNIYTTESLAAMDACADLETVLDTSLKPYLTAGNIDDATLDEIVTNYVDVVVLPTYSDLQTLNAQLYQAVLTFNSNPTDDNFAAAADAWLEARAPWEQSEAFLFGPVDTYGLDPNMDSWPLDIDAIVQVLNSGNFDELNWSDDDDDDAIEAAQNVRGFHTLEFLLFKNGDPRTICAE